MYKKENTKHFFILSFLNVSSCFFSLRYITVN